MEMMESRGKYNRALIIHKLSTILLILSFIFFFTHTADLEYKIITADAIMFCFPLSSLPIFFGQTRGTLL